VTRQPRFAAARVLRGWLFAGASSGMAIAAHALAGGGLPDTGLILLLTCLTAAIGTSFAARWRSGPAMLAVLGTAQLGMHLVLSMPDNHLESAHVQEPAMTGLHALAVVLTAVLLTKADAVLRALTAVVTDWLPVPLTAPRTPAAPLVLPILAGQGRQELHVLLHRVHTRRGPPVHY
jgi:hypothetical protein